MCALAPRLCASVRLGGEEGWSIKGTYKGSFDDVTSFILRRHQKNLCLSLLQIYGPSSSLLSLRPPPPPLKGSPASRQPLDERSRLVCNATVKNKGGDGGDGGGAGLGGWVYDISKV